jgi:hypothetical protein
LLCCRVKENQSLGKIRFGITNDEVIAVDLIADVVAVVVVDAANDGSPSSPPPDRQRLRLLSRTLTDKFTVGITVNSMNSDFDQ